MYRFMNVLIALVFITVAIFAFRADSKTFYTHLHSRHYPPPDAQPILGTFWQAGQPGMVKSERLDDTSKKKTFNPAGGFYLHDRYDDTVRLKKGRFQDTAAANWDDYYKMEMLRILQFAENGGTRRCDTCFIRPDGSINMHVIQQPIKVKDTVYGLVTFVGEYNYILEKHLLIDSAINPSDFSVFKWGVKDAEKITAKDFYVLVRPACKIAGIVYLLDCYGTITKHKVRNPIAFNVKVSTTDTIHLGKLKE